MTTNRCRHAAVHTNIGAYGTQGDPKHGTAMYLSEIFPSLLEAGPETLP